MSEYIEREAVNALIKAECSPKVAAYLIDAVAAIPAADVRPVVTCGRCKYADSFSPACTESTFPLKCLSIRYGGVYPDWFCEHGEIAQKSNCGADMKQEPPKEET